MLFANAFCYFLFVSLFFSLFLYIFLAVFFFTLRFVALLHFRILFLFVLTSFAFPFSFFFIHSLFFTFFFSFLFFSPTQLLLPLTPSRNDLINYNTPVRPNQQERNKKCTVEAKEIDKMNSWKFIYLKRILEAVLPGEITWSRLNIKCWLTKFFRLVFISFLFFIITDYNICYRKQHPLSFSYLLIPVLTGAIYKRPSGNKLHQLCYNFQQRIRYSRTSNVDSYSEL